MHTIATLQQLLEPNYRVDEPLGEGGRAVVYKGFDKLMGLPVAIKYMDPVKTGTGQKDIERFLREARTQARLSHPNITAVRSVLEKEGKYFIIMEYVEGIDLEAMLDASKSIPRLPWKQIRSLFGQILEALAYAHEQGVLHRDIKPANIMVTQKGRVKLADFGIARAVSEPRMTESGVILGTPYYIAPEQIRNKAPDWRLDLYGVGISLYEVLCGRTPFRAPGEPITLQEILRRHVFEQPPSPRTLGVELPDAIEEMLLKSIAKEPEERYASGLEMKAALDHALATVETSPATPETSPAPQNDAAPKVSPSPYAQTTALFENGHQDAGQTPAPAALQIPKDESNREWKETPSYLSQKPEKK